MPYCAYLRKSRVDMEAEDRGEGETLARHRKILLDLAKRLHLNVTQIYEEVVSGETIAARPVMQKLLTEVEQGMWQGVLVVEVERLARGDTVDQGIIAQTFKFSNTKIVTPAKTYDPNNEFDEEYFEFGLFMSRREYKAINRRLQRGRQSSAKEGKFVGSVAPYGYKRLKIEHDKGYTLEIVPEQAEIVKLMFGWYVDGEDDERGERRRLGIQQIARKLNKMQIPPIRNDYWQKATIRDILINPTYAGKIRWGWRKAQKQMVNGKTVVSRPRNYDEDCILSDGLHKEIVSLETFEQAQKCIEECPPAPVGYKSEIKNPLCGIVVCAKCGRKMVLRKGHAPKPDYLICHARACDNVSTPFHLVEGRVLNVLRQWLSEYRLEMKEAESDEKSVASFEKSLKQIESELATLEKQLSSTYDLLEQGIYKTEKFLERSRSISERIEAAKKNRADIEKEIALFRQREDSRKSFIPKIEHLLKVYGTLESIPKKNELLKEILEKAVYNKDVCGSYRGVSADDFELLLYPKLPKREE